MTHDILIDLDTLRDSRNMMGEKFPRIMGYFYEDTENYLQTMEQAVQESNIAAIVPAVHTIKSSCKQIGAEQLSQAAAELEIYARHLLAGEGDAEKLAQMAAGLRKVYVSSCQQLETAIREMA